MKKASKTTVAERARWRSVLLLVGFAFCAAALEGRILYLQLVDRDFLAEQANDRHLRTVQISAHRGTLTDRYGEPLAVSTPVDTVYANPKGLKSALDRLGELATALEVDDEWLARRITSNLDRDFVFLERRVPPATAQQVLDLELPGVGTVREFRRYYPAGEVAGHVVGFTDIDDKGQEGLEAAFDHWLKGEPGSKQVLQDRRGQVFDDVKLLRSARPGRDLRTSIDLRLQYLAYRELKSVVTDSGARSGTVVVLDPRTGEVLAMVNQPSHNPNADRSEYRPDTYRNRAVTDPFEPGSSFKPLVMAAALESGAFSPRTPIDTSGAISINNRVITQDPQDYGRVDLTTVLAKSSNVGMTRMALTLPPESMRHTLTAFGFGEVTGSGFPGESAGMLNESKYWKRIGQATISYGYGLSVTPLQLAHAYATIGAYGVSRPVTLRRVEGDVEGVRAVDERVARELIEMMENVVSQEGTAKRAALNGYRVAGKTGTAWKAAAGGYGTQENRKYTATFGGVVPASRPRLAAIVVIDEPGGDVYYAGDVSAPVFANVMAGALRLMGVPPDGLERLPNATFAQAPMGTVRGR